MEMVMYNLLEYSKNYPKTSGSLWNYYRDELTDETNDDNGPNRNATNSKAFKYKTSIQEVLIMWQLLLETMMEINKTQKKLEIAVPLKYLSNFWRTLDIPLLNCEVSLALN